MASHEYDPKTGKARVFFRFGAEQFNKTLKIESDREVGRLCALIEDTILEVERGKPMLPADADPLAFITSGGKVTTLPLLRAHEAERLTPGNLFDLYRADPPPHLEVSTRKMQEIHFRRLLDIHGSAVRSFAVAGSVTGGSTTRRSRFGRRSGTRRRRSPIVTCRSTPTWPESLASGSTATPEASWRSAIPTAKV